MHNAVATSRAANFVIGQKILSQTNPGDIDFRLVKTALPVAKTLPFQPVVERAISKIVQGLSEDMRIARREELERALLQRLKATLKSPNTPPQSLDAVFRQMRFTGSVHCEATLMGLVANATQSPSPAASSEIDYKVGWGALSPCCPLTRGFSSQILVDKNKVCRIGVGKKSCWCCNRLAELLETPHIRFLSSGTHGIVFPWVLPATGIPAGVGQGLEEELQAHFEHVLGSLAGVSISQSQTSSPARSDPGEGTELGDELEALVKDLFSRHRMSVSSSVGSSLE